MFNYLIQFVNRNNTVIKKTENYKIAPYDLAGFIDNENIKIDEKRTFIKFGCIGMYPFTIACNINSFFVGLKNNIPLDNIITETCKRLHVDAYKVSDKTNNSITIVFEEC